jgi:hypothetical protein
MELRPLLVVWRNAEIRRLIALAKQKNLQVLLCVYNAYTDVSGSGFSWDRAPPAILRRQADILHIANLANQIAEKRRASGCVQPDCP